MSLNKWIKSFVVILGVVLLHFHSNAQTWTIQGSTTVDAGTSVSYELMSSPPTSTPGGIIWKTNSGTAGGSGSHGYVIWGCVTPGTVSVTYANGSPLASLSNITVNQTPAINGGTVTPASQSVYQSGATTTITCPAATGGPCTAPGFTYQWVVAGNVNFINYTLISGATGLNYTPPSTVQGTLYYRRYAYRSSSTGYSTTSVVNVTSALSPGTTTTSTPNVNYNGTASLSTSGSSGGNNIYSYQWQSSADNITFNPVAGQTGQSYAPANLTSTLYYRVAVTSNGSTANTNSVKIIVYPKLVAGTVSPSSVTISSGGNSGVLTSTVATGGNTTYAYQWQISINGLNFNDITGASSLTYTSSALTNTSFFRVSVTSNGETVYSNAAAIAVSNPSEVPPPNVTAGNSNDDMNWIISKTFDETGKTIQENKKFFDDGGRLLQDQDKIKYRRNSDFAVLTHVFASQPLRDVYGRDVINTMSAPINNTEFSYKPNFVLNTAGNSYTYKDFDRYYTGATASTETDNTYNPPAVGGTTTVGTLGWYYGANNFWEPYTPVSGYPYSRQSYYRDGTGNTKRTTGAGDNFKLGSGRVNSQFSVSINNELAEYITLRNKYFSASEVGVLAATFSGQGTQIINRNLDSKQTVSIQDKSGHLLMTALSGGTDYKVTNSVTVSAGTSFYFYLFVSTPVTVAGTNYQLYSMESETVLSGFTSGSTQNSGYYKIINNGTSANITVSYDNYYSDISYSFYNELGQLLLSLSPEGVKKLHGTGSNSYATRQVLPFATLNEYDTRGRLTATTTADGGRTEFVSRNDGKVRFSQNALQKTTSTFSYINYDSYGRTIETGDYKSNSGGITFNSDLTATTNTMRDILENVNSVITSAGGLTNGTKTDITWFTYDVIDVTIGLPGYIQDEFFLKGKVSSTRKYSQSVNNAYYSSDLISQTWYNYDEDGQVIWKIQKIQGLDAKTMEYTYDALGNITQTVYQKNTSSDTWAQWYGYDLDTKQLWWDNYSRTNNFGTSTGHAWYQYFLHGGLKRLWLNDGTQGADYTYTLDGSLKAINNSDDDPAKDPGGDASDAFGEVLDYYPGDYVNGRTGTKAFIPATNTTDSYSGTVRAMTWHTKKTNFYNGTNPGYSATENENTYIYSHDDHYRFTESTWGNSLNFGTNPASFNSTGYNKEKILDPNTLLPAYDANGNILKLQRYGVSGSLADNFAYNYNPNNNQLASITNVTTSSPYATYGYDQIGQLISEVNSASTQTKYIKYDAAGKVTLVARDAGYTQKVAEYLYDEMGNRVVAKSYNSTGVLIQVTYYVGDDAIYTQPVTSNGTAYGTITLQELTIKGLSQSRMGTYMVASGLALNEWRDHLGNIRAITTTGSKIWSFSDYYPFGSVIRSAGDGYRYGYQGAYAEKDGGTGWNSFDLRMYDSRIARWLVRDPKGASISPYSAMDNDPVGKTDPDGGSTESTHTDAKGTVVEVVNDGNLGIYKHDDLDGWNGTSVLSNSGPGVTLMGYSKAIWSFANWDVLKNTDWRKQTILDVSPGTHIAYGSNWAGKRIMESLAKMTGFWTDYAPSANGGVYDLKYHTPATDGSYGDGKRYYGSQISPGLYVSAREAGNILAGMVIQKYNMGLKFVMRSYGGLNQANNSFWGAVGNVIGNVFTSSLDKKRYYGEDEMSGSSIMYGNHNYSQIMYDYQPTVPSPF